MSSSTSPTVEQIPVFNSIIDCKNSSFILPLKCGWTDFSASGATFFISSEVLSMSWSSISTPIVGSGLGLKVII
jgi:hypothetical protein